MYIETAYLGQTYISIEYRRHTLFGQEATGTGNYSHSLSITVIHMVDFSANLW